ncbi:hypothetical protein NIES2101_16780 [Calothrix sp. HK-06]|nr:hypothetical protein NIES2101_16780 [Calothrix sp. HK-06]
MASETTEKMVDMGGIHPSFVKLGLFVLDYKRYNVHLEASKQCCICDDGYVTKVGNSNFKNFAGSLVILKNDYKADFIS